MVKVTPLAAPQLGSCASSGHVWRLWAAWHSQGGAGPLGAQPLPRVLELAASKAACDPLDTPLTLQARRFQLRAAAAAARRVRHAARHRVWHAGHANPTLYPKTDTNPNTNTNTSPNP
eukprot:scaffold41375_cov43-Phaeocystis_antarctica.AAC.2